MTQDVGRHPYLSLPVGTERTDEDSRNKTPGIPSCKETEKISH